MVVMGFSGFMTSRGTHISRLQIRTAVGMILAIACAVLLCVFAFTLHRKKPCEGNVITFAAGFILGLTHY